MDELVAAADPGDGELFALVSGRLAERRWFPAKGAGTRLEPVGGITLHDPRGEATVRILLIRARAPGVDAVLQVPLTIRDAAGVLGGAADVRDGVGDPAFLRAWLAAADGPGAPVDPGLASVVVGEQSNTSVVLPATSAEGTGAILKVFRALCPGDNPDVDVPRALADAGWAHVPRPLAWLTATWRVDGTTARGHLGVMSELVPDARDGFELACTMAARGESFAGLARELGAVVAEMHEVLARALPVKSAASDADPRDALAGALRERFRWACAAVPELRRYAANVERLAAEARTAAELPHPQRIHGDLHLGQVLHATAGWFVLDFEGEPLAPLAERTRPDLALRDVAGLLRSFDYASAVGGGGAGTPVVPDPRWVDDARRGLLAGYRGRPETADAAGRDGGTGSALLLRAFEVDKALYEAVYEARNRPAWLPIPLSALDRLFAESA